MKKILAFGEVLWDMIPSGKQIGGAPGNFAYHARVLGADARILSRVGNDKLGAELLDEFRKAALPTDQIELDTELPTGTVDVELDRNGQPKYQIIEDVAWDRIDARQRALDFAAAADAVCFGTLAARSETNLRALGRVLTKARPGTLRVLDLNLRAPFYSKDLVLELLPLANVLKINDEELITLMSFSGRKAAHDPFMETKDGRTVLVEEKQEAVERLMTDWRMKHLILTCGQNGSFLFSAGQRGAAMEQNYTAAVNCRVVNTVGAGDAFTAVATIGFLKQYDLAKINRHANRYAAYVCTQPGGMPLVPDELTEWG